MTVYDQPFYVGDRGNRFKGVRRGYLPPLELPDTQPEPLPPDERYFLNRLDHQQALIVDLGNRLNQHIDQSRTRSRGRTQEPDVPF